MGIEPGFPAGVVLALSCWAIFPVLTVNVYKLWWLTVAVHLTSRIPFESGLRVCLCALDPLILIRLTQVARPSHCEWHHDGLYLHTCEPHSTLSFQFPFSGCFITAQEKRKDCMQVSLRLVGVSSRLLERVVLLCAVLCCGLCTYYYMHVVMCTMCVPCNVMCVSYVLCVCCDVLYRGVVCML